MKPFNGNKKFHTKNIALLTAIIPPMNLSESDVCCHRIFIAVQVSALIYASKEKKKLLLIFKSTAFIINQKEKL